MEYEWDEKKNLINAIKHGIRFEDAREGFTDPLKIVESDPEHSTEHEKREHLIGSVGGRIMLVAFTRRRNNIRLISARPADRIERSLYEWKKEKLG